MGKPRSQVLIFSENDSKNLILHAGLRLLNSFGYHALTLSAIAREAKTSKQRVSYYYPDTDALLLDLARIWDKSGIQATLEKLAETPGSGAERIFGMADGMFKWMQEYPEITKLTLVLYQTAPFLNDLKSIMDEALKTGRKRIQFFMEHEAGFRSLAPKEQSQLVSQIHAYLYGFLFYVNVMNQYESIELYHKTCSEGLKKLLLKYL